MNLSASAILALYKYNNTYKTLFISAVDVGRELGYTEKTTYNLLWKGTFPLPAENIGRHRAVSIYVFIDFIMQQANISPSNFSASDVFNDIHETYQTMFISVVDAGRELGYADKTVRNLLAKGTFPLPTEKIGGLRVVSILVLAKFVIQRSKIIPLDFSLSDIQKVIQETYQTMFISVVDAGREIGYAEKTTRNLLSEGRFPLPTEKIGAKRVVSSYDLAKFVIKRSSLRDY
jgi:predicted DNA-binding transcriptional regulator AlpA